MIKILFVCLGNICRSPMAEFILKDMVKKENLENKFIIHSAATSSSTSGEDMYEEAKIKLKENQITYTKHKARKILQSDYEKYDYIIGMDDNNIKDILYVIKEDKNKKVYKLLDFTQKPRDILDPWYTGNFTKAYDDIKIGCQGLLNYLINLKQF